MQEGSSRESAETFGEIPVYKHKAEEKASWILLKTQEAFLSFKVSFYMAVS